MRYEPSIPVPLVDQNPSKWPGLRSIPSSFLAKHSLKERLEVNERANPAQKPLAEELNLHAGQLTGELNHHVGLAGELYRRVVILARRAQPSRRSARWSARRRAEPSCGCTRPVSSTIAPVCLPAS
ncbi:hypothetical protein F2Q69_00012982 [Brassica cretica]|uniref:Uncharacterized protein n=1 Tax=Brassica cretica TaxID=69181 RepID=A0A8S9QNW5_BRACR|nr:hypothetical protein F2Q69_00012982 [Brassica cretica]